MRIEFRWRWGLCGFLMLLALTLVACGRARPDLRASNEEVLFWRASYDFQRGRYEDARIKLQTLISQVPTSPLVPEARLGVGRSYFEQGRYEEARLEYGRFLIFHPRHERMDEALYFIALSYFRQMDRVDRDQTPTVKALVGFRQLLTEVPGTPYKEDARQKITQCRFQLASRDLAVGLFYLHRGDYRAARGRLERILDEYPDVGLTPKALFYLGETYREEQQAEKAEEYYRQVLATDPNSEWAARAGKRLGVTVVVSPDKVEPKSSAFREFWDLVKESWRDLKHSLGSTVTAIGR